MTLRRSLPYRLLPGLLMLAVGGPLVAASAWSEDVAPGSKPAIGKTARASHDREAATIGRDLLSTNAKVRDAALARLLAHVTKVRAPGSTKAADERASLEAFFKTLARSARDWADRRERLLEVWVEQAVHGNARERDEASRLLAALGPAAVQRLATELRHARAQGGEAGKRLGGRVTPSPKWEVESKAKPEPGPEPVRAAGTPRLYNVLDLLRRGMTAVEVRSLLQKAPNAVSVKNVSRGVYVVTAEDDGHIALRVQLELLRTRQEAAHQEREPGPETPKITAKRAMPKADRPAPGADRSPRKALPDSPATPAVPSRDAAEPAPATLKVAVTAKDGRQWRVLPTIFRVAPSVLTDERGGYGVANRNPGLPVGIDPAITEVRTGTELDAATWMRVLERRSRGERGVLAEGKPTVCAGTCCSLFAGTTRPYRKSFRRDGDGTFHYEMGALRLGIDFDITLVPRARALDVRFVASRTEVALPMPMDTVKPGPGLPPIELDRPEWSRTRTRTAFVLPMQGGSAFLSLGGLGTKPDEHVVVVLRILPVQTAEAVDAPERKPVGK